MATVFILQDKTWIERGHGLVRFVFDLRTFALRLVIRPGTPEEFECKLRPRIRSKGPRAYVVRAQAVCAYIHLHSLFSSLRRSVLIPSSFAFNLLIPGTLSGEWDG